jgi:hypothetical protein
MTAFAVLWILAKCWWHDLKDVKVTNSMKISENVDLKLC